MARRKIPNLAHPHSRRWRSLTLSLPIALLGIVATVLIVQRQLRYETEQVEGWTSFEADALADEITEELTPQVLALVRMAERWRRSGGLERSEWEADARLIAEHYAGYQAIEWVDPSFHVRWVAPLEGNEAAQDLGLAFERRRREALELARDGRRVTVTQAVELVQGGTGILVCVPLFHSGRFDGFVLGVSRVRDFFDPIVADVRERGFGIAVFDGDDLIYTDGRRDTEPTLREERIVEFYGADWRIVAEPTQQLLALSHSDVTSIMLPIGISFALLFATGVGLWQSARERAAEVTVANRELDHRVKNTLATVQAVADQTLLSAPSREAFQTAFRGRIQALAAIHEALASANWSSLDLARLIDLTVVPYGAGRANVRAGGPSVDLPAGAVRPLGLALHELATNAAKHGALSCEDGRVDLRWEVVQHGEEQQLSIQWTESGGPPVELPISRNFGLNLVERSMPFELDGAARIEFDRSGARCIIEFLIPAA